MPYLGNIPATQFAELKYQDFTGGTGTSFTLNDPVGSAQELEVFVNNVRQEPGVAYTVSGTALTMTGSIVASDDFYVVFQGKSIPSGQIPEKQSNGDYTFDDGTLFVDASTDRVGIGTTSPAAIATIKTSSNEEDALLVEQSDGTDVGSLRINNGAFILKGKNSSQPIQIQTHDGNEDIEVDPDGFIKMETAGSERLRIDSSGNVGIGTTSGDVLSDGNANRTYVGIQGNGNRGFLSLGTSSSAGADVATLMFNNGTNQVGSIVVDSKSGSTTEGSMQFYTSGSEAMRINEDGRVLIAKNTTNFDTAGIRMDTELNVTRASATPVFINRTGNDGGLIQFYQAGTEEGSISVSGSSVNYNGGVLSRWSRLIDDTTPASLVRGTVMSNLDSMIVWSHDAEDAVVDEDGNEITPAKDAYDEDNEKLNHTQVSTVEGDINSAGVFMAWDNDDDNYNDFYLAMTGDFVIRIASGTTVARGDLLMSAGDGTAKPQDDDIVRSKTIAKVTSTTVSHTYDDGSYLVPCVLMAC